MVDKRPTAGNSSRRRPPATTPEGRELQLQSYAYDLAEKQLIQGTASSQVITYFLKTASLREQRELERLKNENLLTEAKIEQIKSTQGQETLLKEAIAAFTDYSGSDDEDAEF